MEELFQSEPEPWERAISKSELRHYVPLTQSQFDDEEFDDWKWMMGSAELPRWLGYSLGYALVGLYLDDYPDACASTLVATPSANFKPFLAKLAA